jgi:DNA-binding response OmpR family regulator
MIHSQRILIVSDEALSDFMRKALEQRGFAVTAVPDRAGAYQQLHETSFDLLIIDLARASEGVEFLRKVRATPKLRKTLILTIAEWGTGQPTVALSEGADAYEPKPISAERLIAAVERLLRQEMVKTATATNGSGGIENDE